MQPDSLGVLSTFFHASSPPSTSSGSLIGKCVRFAIFRSAWVRISMATYRVLYVPFIRTCWAEPGVSRVRKNMTI